MSARQPIVLVSFSLAEIAYSPLGPQCLAAALDADPELGPRLEPRIRVARPDMSDAALDDLLGSRRPAALLCTLLPWHRGIQRRLMRRAAQRWPGLAILAGGPEVANHGPRVFEIYPELWSAATGEGEGIIAELVAEALAGDGRRRLVEIPVARGREYDAGPGNPTDFIDAYPPGAVICYETVRGCPLQCSYCRWSPGSYRCKPLDQVEADLRRIGHRPDAGGLWILDGTFNAGHERPSKILELIARHVRCGPVTLFMDLGHRRLRPAFVDACVAANVQVWSVGMQTLSDESLRAVGRGYREQVFADNVALLRTVPEAQRPILDLDLIFGLPGVSHDAFARDVDLALAHEPEVLHAFRLQVFPDTPLYAARAEHGLVLDADCFVRSSATCDEAAMAASDDIALGLHGFYNRLHYFRGVEPEPLVRFHELCARRHLRPAEFLGAWRYWLKSAIGIVPAEAIKLPTRVQLRLVDHYLDLIERLDSSARAGHVLAHTAA